MTHDCDVLVVGAGPVGMALALELALQGVSFRIIDRVPVRNENSRALVMQPRTLELLNRHGAADTMISRGRIVRGGEVYINKQRASGLRLDDLGTTDTEFPLPLNVSQVETEKFLDECLSKYDISVERPVTATSIIQDDTGVTSTLELPDGKSETIRSKYVVGCDGAHSVVRHASEKMTFPGAPYPQDFVLCDVHLHDSNIDQNLFSLHLSNKGVLGLLPINNEIVRVVASRSQLAVEDQDLPTLDQLQAYFTTMTPPGSGTLYDPVWLTRFRLHHRCVNQYRDGRLFVAGDAAHIHSPAGGQGMNAGIQDAINLGWKLAHSLSLQSQQPKSDDPQSFTATAAAAAADALLDTYDLERRPVGLALLQGTDRIFAFISSPNPWFVPFRNFVLRHIVPRVSKSQARRKKMFHFMSQFGVSYRGCTRLVGEASSSCGFFRRGAAAAAAAVRGGDRLPDGKLWRDMTNSDERETSLQRVCVGAPHHLLLFSGRGGGLGQGGELERAAERVVAACHTVVKVHYIAGDDGGRLSQGGPEWFADPAGGLHARFGFGDKAGYVLVRPDGYVAHIGPLAKLDQFVSFLDGYLVSPVVTPFRSRLSFVSPVVWAAVGACLAVNLWREIAHRF
ncbi:FAD binding domain-containing protein [Chaetomidium leptoderma]|uniref:FAD binding domain-containing protein n=1 Tax=Chaetomidium leptoderma TaxID=669021 RepID=A0AAN6VTJ2_9PEZI|nr:FAD binding domain-containing protein [Chaetomidium leptoderma]